MEKVTVNKAEALAILKTNRAKHRDIFLEALDGYGKEATKILTQRLEEVKKGSRKQIYISLPEPSDHTKDYDRAIKMLEMNISDTVMLSEQDFNNYVMDDWNWKQQFLQSNSMYSATATAALNN